MIVQILTGEFIVKHTHAKQRRMIHYTCTSYDQYLPKLQRYAAVQAALWHQDGRRASARQMLLRGPLRFVQGYVFRLGFLDGLAGLQVCALIAYLSYLKHARLWELEHARAPHRLPVVEVPMSDRSAA